MTAARRRCFAVLALAASSLALPASASAAPEVVVDQTRVLPEGGTVTVRGAGFTATDPGIYVAFGPRNATGQSAFSATRWVRPSGTGELQLRPDGSFKVTLPVKQVTGTTDCATVPDGCAIRTMRAHGQVDPTQSTTTPITFGPVVDVDRPRTVPAGGTVTVSGAGFAADATEAGRGVYLAFGPNEPEFWKNRTGMKTTKWLRGTTAPSATGGPMGADGTFTTTLDVAETYTTSGGATVDCRALQHGCAIFTFAAHGWGIAGGVLTERKLDTVTPVTFGPTLTVTPGRANAAGDTLTVSGAGFRTDAGGAAKGVYLGFGPNRPSFWETSGTWLAQKWIRGSVAPTATAGPMNADGTFTTTLPARALYTPARGGEQIDCDRELRGCAVLAMSSASWGFAGGVPTDRTQDDVVPVELVTPPAEQPREDPPTTGGGTQTTPSTTPGTQPLPQPRPLPLTRPSLSRPALSPSRLTFRVSEPAKVTATIRREVTRRVRRGGKVVRVRRWAKVRTLSVQARRAGTVRVNPRLTRAGRYRVTLVAVAEATGRRGKAKVFTATVRRAARR